MKKTPEQIVESIPEEDRGHVFHLLGKALGHKGGVTTQDAGTGISNGDGDSGNTPPPPPPKKG